MRPPHPASLTPTDRRTRGELLLHPDALRTLERHASDAYPEEACGWLLGPPTSGGAGARVVDSARPARNVAAGDRRRAFELASEEFRAEEARAAREGRTLVGVYHSHPDRPARPSIPDRSAAWPGLVYVIARVTRQQVSDVAAYELEPLASTFVRRPIVLTEDPGGTVAPRGNNLTGSSTVPVL